MTMRDLPKFEIYEEGSRIRRSVKSIRSNIVEGYGRRRYLATRDPQRATRNAQPATRIPHHEPAKARHPAASGHPAGASRRRAPPPPHFLSHDLERGPDRERARREDSEGDFGQGKDRADWRRRRQCESGRECGGQSPDADRCRAERDAEETGAALSRSSRHHPRRRNGRIQECGRRSEHLQRGRRDQRRVRHGEMKSGRGAVCLVQAALIFSVLPVSLAQQRTPEVRRAQPVDEPPVPRALPADESTPIPSPRPRRSPSEPTAPSSENPPTETEAPDRRQLDYANALFSRKL